MKIKANDKELYKKMWLKNKATIEEVKVAYKKLAMEYHPDREWWIY
jgi:DnaJ-class molecular chaperone